jgi:LPS-assembly lipoprotein
VARLTTPHQGPETSRRQLLRAGTATVLATAAGLLSGCGFELRLPPELPYKRIMLKGFKDRSEMKAALLRAFPADTQVVDSPSQAEVILIAIEDQTYRVVAASTTSGQVREFRLRVHLNFQLNRPDGSVLLPPTELERSEDLSYTETAALAKQTEEADLLKFMRNDLAQQVLRMLVVTSRHAPVAAAAASSGASEVPPQPKVYSAVEMAAEAQKSAASSPISAPSAPQP